jgi:hypothetical protein
MPIQAAASRVQANGRRKDVALVNLATGISAFYCSVDGTNNIAYVGDDGDIWILTVKAGSSMTNVGLAWTATDVTAEVKSSHASYVPPLMSQISIQSLFVRRRPRRGRPPRREL